MGKSAEQNYLDEFVARNEDGTLEIVNMHTGEVVVNTAAVPATNTFVFSYPKALEIIQYVKEGKTLSDIAAMPGFPPLYVISHWQRTDKMFAQEMIFARKERAEVYHDRAMKVAMEAAAGMYGKDQVPGAKLAVDTFKWGAERGNPDRYGNKVVHEGNDEKPILMRVINTGIDRRKNKPDVEVVGETKEITHVKTREETIRQDEED